MAYKKSDLVLYEGSVWKIEKCFSTDPNSPPVEFDLQREDGDMAYGVDIEMIQPFEDPKPVASATYREEVLREALFRS